MSWIKERLGWSEVIAKGRRAIWRPLLAEFIGNLFLNLLGCASVVTLNETGSSSNLLISLTFGLVLASVVQVVCHVSGGHINPAVTIAMMVTNNITIIKGILYILVQCAGSTIGSLILRALTPENLGGNLGMTTVHKHLDVLQGFGMEFFLGFLLLFVIFGVCDPHRDDVKGSAPLAIGLAVAACHFSAINYTGSSINPARTFGSAVVSGIWDNQWVYWFGPILGGIAAALIYKHCLAAPAPTSRNAGDTEYSPVRVEEKEMKSLNKDDNVA
ncbi:aquaporin AQPAe.a-like [Neocloeon triangulifer]|uniref:aquaporin AQPAe.a-like n=1 Tax=Neocloeon triangulifer TaxID=2078957 RepID=UPI00286F408E|nr:aquaporin AQPAe.a-like [Neocloeon triangulifer]